MRKRFKRILTAALAIVLTMGSLTQGFGITGKITASAQEAGEISGPSAENVTITGEPKSKNIISVEYDYIRQSAQNEGASTYRWLIADTADGNYTEITGVYTPDLILIYTYKGKYIKAEVTPVDLEGKKGTPVTSQPILVSTEDGNDNVTWMRDSSYGLCHHVLADWVNRVAANEDEKWKEGGELGRLL